MKQQIQMDHYDLLISPAVDLTEIALEKLVSSLKNDKTKIDHEIYIPFVFAYSTSMVYSSLIRLAERRQVISSAILSRSILEAMANTNWLYESISNTDELRHKTSNLYSQSQKIFNVYQYPLTKIPSIKDMGGGTISSRLDALGEGWLVMYRHLSSFAHMDGGFAVHYEMKETQGMINLSVLYATMAIENIIEQLINLMHLSPEHAAILKSQLQEISDALNKARQEISKSANKLA